MIALPTLPQLFWSVVDDATLSRNIAVSAEGVQIDYAALGVRVLARMAFLLDAGIAKGERVVLLQNRTIDVCADILAVMCLGASVAVLSRNESIEVSCGKAKAIQAKLMITDHQNEVLAAQIAGVCNIDLERVKAAPTLNGVSRPPIPEGRAEALVVFTSGSTGEPKAAAISHNNIASNINGVKNIVPVSAVDHFLQVMPLGHTNGLLNQLILPLAVGARVTLLPFFEAGAFMDALVQYRPTIVTCVPTMLTRLLDQDIPASAVKNLRFIRSGAAPLLPDTHKKVEAHFGRKVVVSYGQSEVTCTNTANPPDARKIGSVGKVLDGQEMAICEIDGTGFLPQGKIGEVCFRGTSISMGLLGSVPFDPSEWFHTGDCGYVDSEGYLFLTGRLKDIIIRGGANLSPRQIEDVILRQDTVKSVTVVGLADADLGEVPVACIEPSGKAPLSLDSINTHITTALSPAHQLRDLFEFYRLPQNETGKVNPMQVTQYVVDMMAVRGGSADNQVRCEDTAPLLYIDRTKHYYATLGFGAPYEWERNTDIPLAKLSKPLDACSVAIVTTAALFQPEHGDQGPGAPYNAQAKFYDVYHASTDALPDLRISHIAIDRDNTSAEDIGTYFPLSALKRAAGKGRIGRVAKHFYGLPTNRSKRITKTVDSQKLLAQLQADGVDLVILVPNCPVCHQSVTLAARTLEAAGIPTVITGCARDIVEQVGPPRFLFNDFPLGNSAGRPHDPQSQDIVLNAVLDMFESVKTAGATQQSPLKWVGRKDWKTFYSNPDLLSHQEIEQKKAKFEQDKELAKKIREASDRKEYKV